MCEDGWLNLSVIPLVSRQGVVTEFFGQRRFFYKQGQHFLEPFLRMSRLLKGTPKILLELLTVANPKH